MKLNREPGRGLLRGKIMTRDRFGLLLLLSAALLQVGCSGDRPKLALVTGVVTYNGAPVSGASVSFSSDVAPRNAVGTTDASGKYQLTTYEANDGAILGDYKVTVFKADSTGVPAVQMVEVGGEAGGPSQPSGAGSLKVITTLPAANSGNGPMSRPPPTVVAKSLLPSKYADLGKSGLTAKVVEGKTNQHDFGLSD